MVLETTVHVLLFEVLTVNGTFCARGDNVALQVNEGARPKSICVCDPENTDE